MNLDHSQLDINTQVAPNWFSSKIGLVLSICSMNNEIAFGEVCRTQKTCNVLFNYAIEHKQRRKQPHGVKATFPISADQLRPIHGLGGNKKNLENSNQSESLVGIRTCIWFLYILSSFSNALQFSSIHRNDDNTIEMIDCAEQYTTNRHRHEGLMGWLWRIPFTQHRSLITR